MQSRLTHKILQAVGTVFVAAMVAVVATGAVKADDLPAIRQRGTLRHLGVPYANFVSGAGDGLDVELVQRFARHIGVTYVYVKTDWSRVISDLTGLTYQVRNGNEVTVTGKVAVRGDMIANGMTILAWRRQLVDFSIPTFPTQVWLVARADVAIAPIHPSNNIQLDIAAVRNLLKNRVILGKSDTCTDPAIFKMNKFLQALLRRKIGLAGAIPRLFAGTLNELAPAVINGEAEATILDVPDALVALERWPGQLKIIGPVSDSQEMGCGFAKDAPLLRAAFNAFFEMCKMDGTYNQLVKKYYPAAFLHFPGYFE